MTYKGLFAVTELISDICDGKEIKFNNDSKVDLAEAGNLFSNILIDVNKKKVKSKEPVMYYRLAIEVNK